MKTINQTLTARHSPLGRWTLWTNSVIGQLDQLRVYPRQRVGVYYEPVEYVSTDGHVWQCQHVQSSPQTVIVLPDDSEVVEICDACDAQLIDGEWA